MRLLTTSLILVFLFPIIHSCTTSSSLKASSTKNRVAKSPSKSAGLVRSAGKYLGSRYKYGGNGPRQFDCSGLVHLVFAENNVDLPRSSAEQAKVGKAISLSAVKAGDLLFFSKNKNGGPINHVAIVVAIGNGKYWAIHSTTSKGVIREDILSSPYWGDRFRFARRVL